MNSPRLRTSSVTPAPIGRRGRTLSAPIGRRIGLAPRPLLPTAPRLSAVSLPPVAPDPPSMVKARAAAVEQARTRSAEPQKEPRPWWSPVTVAQNILAVPRLIASIGKASPVIATQTAQTLYGGAQEILGRPVAIVDGKPVTRYQQDMAEAKAQGLGRIDRVVKATERSMPLVSQAIQSMRTLPPFLAETATGGLIDTGAPGFDVYQAYRRGQLPQLLFEQGGNIILAGRLAGLGNIGTRLGQRIARPAAPGTPRARLGSGVETVGRFTEEPIATTIRGIAGGVSRLGREYAQRAATPISPRMSRFLDTMEMMSTSKSPLMTGATRAAESFRLGVDVQLAEYDTKIANLQQERRQADRSNQTEKVAQLDDEIKKLEGKRKSRQKMGETTFQARRTQEESTRREAARQGYMRAVAIRFDELGAAPEPIETMRARAAELRSLADQRESQAVDLPAPQADELRGSAQTARNLADFNDRMADVKQANPEKLQDVENRAVNFEAANIVNSKLIDQIMADLEAGMTFDEVMARVQPKELVQRTIEAGYGYTREGVQRAIDFVRGAVDEVDRLEMDVASQILNMFAAEMSDYAMQPGTLVGGILSPAQFGDTAVPEIFIAELSGKGFENRVLAELDAVVPEVVTASYPELLDQYPDLIDDPKGSFTKFAKSRPDSPEYAVARETLGLVADVMSDPQTSIFRSDPRLALEVAEFFNRPAIYPARMRPMLAYRASVSQAARAADVQDLLFNLRQIADEFPDVLSEGRKKSLQDLLDTLAASDTAVFDREFYMKTRDLLSGVIGDITRRRQGTGARLGEIGRRTAESDARLAAIETQARAAAGMVEQALLRSEELPTASETARRAELDAEIARLRSEGDVAGAARLVEERERLLQGTETADATIRRSLDNVETGKPFEGVLYRGTGGINVQGTGADSLFGPGVYATPDLQYAETFASDFTDVAQPRLVGNVEQVSVRLQNPLVIRTADQWRNLTREAGWEFPKISRGSDARPLLASLRQLIESQGYDGVIIKYDPNMPPNSALADMAGGEQVVAFSPEAVMPAERRARLGGVTQESQTLRQQADELRAEAGRLQTQTDPLNQLRLDIETENTKLDAARDTQENLEAEVQQLQTRLGKEQKLLDDAALDEEGMVLLLAEIDEAASLARSGIGVDPTLTEQKAWKEQKIREAREREDLAARNFESISGGAVPAPQRKGDLKATATGGVQEVNVRRRGGLAINRMWLDQEDYANYIARGIPNRSHRRAFFRDHTVKGKRRDPATGIEMPTEGSTIGEVAGALSEEEFLTRLTQAYSDYMNARDEVKRLESMPYKSKYGEQVKEAMIEDQRELLGGHPWINPITGEETRGIRPLGELRQVEAIARDQDTLAEQVRLVRNLQEEVRTKQASLQSARRATQEIDGRIAEMAFRSGQIEGSSPQFQASRLLNNAERLVTEADRLEAENVRLRPTVAKERVTLTRQSGKRLRAANARRAEGREVTGYEFTKGVAKKLDDAQTAELREQQRLYEQNRELQVRLNAEDEALFASREVESGTQQYPQALGAPSGANLLRGVDRPRLLGETDQPTWMPVGEASGVFESVRAPKTITTEGMAQEQRLSIENQRQSTFMPLTPGQFAARMNDILNQTSRNRVVNSILTNEQFVSDVETLLTPERYEELRSQAENRTRATGIDRDSAQFKEAVELDLGNNLITELERLGFEPVSSVVMPDPTNPYAERKPVGDLLGRVGPLDMKPTTLVMKKGLRENIAAQYQLASTENLPAIPAQIMKWAQEKTAAWKSVVLPFSTRWQVGDAMGNIINAYVRAGLSPADTARLMVEIYNRVNPDQPMTIPKMAQPIFSQSINDPVISVLVGAGLQTSNIKLSELNRMHPKGSLKPSVGAGRFGKRFFPKIREASFNLNETQNALARSAVAQAKLEQQLQMQRRTLSEIDPGTLHNDPVLYEAVVEAVKSANDALGNFSKMSFGEKQYIRTVYPFWSWIRFINTAAGELLLSQPDRVLFYAHLGSMALGDDAEEFRGWMKDQVPVPTPWGTFLMDLSFLNPYSDALILSSDPFSSSVETATGISPVLSLPLGALAEGYYSATGSPPPLLRVGSRPGYLEGRPGETTRTLGDTLGGLGYQTFRAFAGPFRLATEIAPTVRVPGTDVLLGPGPRYPQGSPRTTGIYSRARLSPTQQRISALLRTFGIPAPTADIEQARLQSAEQRRAGARALRRRENERRLSRIGR